jgi:hypothetical protein
MPGWGTAAAASVFIALTLSSNATTVRPRAGAIEQEVRPAKRASTQLLSTDDSALETDASRSLSNFRVYDLITDVERPTTSREKLIGELRRLAVLKENWDTEGAAAPDAKSLEESIAFARLLGTNSPTPESMLLHSGHAGLFWHNETMYADLEFLGDGRIAYFIERQGDKHKGVAKFNFNKMPAVFPVLLEG